MEHILVVEDEPITAQLIRKYLGKEGYSVTLCSTAEEAQSRLNSEVFHAMIVDLQLPGISGLELLERTVKDGKPPSLVLTADQDVTSVVRAMKAGAVDFLLKPLTPQLLQLIVARLVQLAQLKSRLALLESAQEAPKDPQESESQAMRQALALARKTAASDAAAVLLVGESGVGKEVMATYIHQNSPRAKGPFVRINIAAIPDSMIEAELFGAVRGAFTDSKRDREGFFAAANRGTLLLDEIGELKPELQAKLLRAIETKKFYPVGASREVSTDVRIIAATNRDPERAVHEGLLRADLYYRLATVVVNIPPLRERPEDIPSLAGSLLRSLRRPGQPPLQLSPEAQRALRRYHWPGNVRELRNVLERATILSDQPIIALDDLRRTGFLISSTMPPPAADPTPAASPTPAQPRPQPRQAERRKTLAEVAQGAYEEAERAHIAATLEETHNNRTKAASLLGVSRSTLWQKLRKYGLCPTSEGDLSEAS